MDIAPFTGGRRFMLGSAAVGVAGVLLTAVGIAIDPAKGWSSWLLAFTYWAGLSMASLIMVATFRAAAAKWTTVLRRQMEQHASAIVVCAVAFIPLCFGLRHLYIWANAEHVAVLPEHTRALLEHKRPWLNTPGFIVRGFVYLAIFCGGWYLLDRVSRAQDGRPPDLALRSRARGIAAGSLPFLAYAMTFSGVDWLMSLEPTWYSTIFGAYWFAGAFVSAFALLLVVTVLPVDSSLPSSKATVEHTANLGSLMFAFSCFWAYIGFSQYMIIWHGNVPEETTWLFARGLFNLARFHRGIDPPTTAAEFNPIGSAWFPVAVLLMIGRFGVPFVVLMSYRVKHGRNLLTSLALWILAMQLVDLFWVIKPALRLFSPDLALPASALAWTDLTAWLGLGGLCCAYVVWRMRGVVSVPVNDPTLEDSLHYHQPMA
jgi:hypothetical protein